MSSDRITLPSSVVAAGVAMIVVGFAFVAAQTATIVASFTATTVGLNPGSGETLKIDLLRWSTAAEAEKLAAAFTEKDAKQWAQALEGAPTVGYIWASGESLGYSVRYAQHFPLPGGGERVIVASDRQLGSWGREAWKASGQSATQYPFAVIELRLNRNGIGEGKASLAAKVAFDPESKAIGLESYASAPVILKGVKRSGTAVPRRRSAGANR